MTNSTEKATWPRAIGCYFGGAALPTVVGVTFAGLFRALADFGLSGFGLPLFGALVVLVAVMVAVRLPRRARAMFVAGVCTPIAFAIAALIWLLWAFSNYTF